MKKNEEFSRKPAHFLKSACLALCLVSYGGSAIYAASTYAEQTTLTVRMNNRTVKDVFNYIEKNSEFIFVYHGSNINLNRKVNVDVNNQTVEAILKKMFEGTDIEYIINDRQIIVRKNEINKKQVAVVAPQQEKKITVTGNVKDATGEPLIGVNVLVKGTTIGGVTDVNGNYSLSDVAPNAVISISYIGYKTQDIPLNGKSTLNVTLSEDSETLDEVVVVGYGTQKKVNLSGAVSQVTSKTLENRPVASLGAGLQGAIPNLNITMASGRSTDAPSFNVRGMGSINGGSPLILVDNIPTTETELSRLNPNDIESVSVLKDAASAAIYGARASYGVVLITTRTGKSEDIQVAVNAYYTGKNIGRKPDIVTNPYLVANYRDIMSSPWYDLYTDEQLDYAQKVSQGSADPIRLNPKDSRYYEYYGATDWFDEVYTNNSPSYTVNFSVSQKTKKLNYYISGEYYAQDGIMKYGNDKYDRYNLRSKVELKITDWLKLTNNTSFTNTKYDEPVWGGWDYFHQVPRTPTLSPTKNPDGTWTQDGASMLGRLQEGGRADTRNNIFNTSFGVNIDIIKDVLAVRGDANFVRSGEDYDKWDGPIDYYNGPEEHNVVGPSVPYAYKWNRHIRYNVFNAVVDFHKTFGDHYLQVLGGYNQESRYSNEWWAQRKELISTGSPEINLATGDMTMGNGTQAWALRGVFYRLNYIFKERYIIETNGRYDGTSRFPKNDRFGFFPSVSAAWVVSNEEFFKNFNSSINDTFSLFKLRASYGSLGNQIVDKDNAYAHIATMGSGTSNWILGGKKPTYVSSPGLVSASLTWEKVHQYDFGFDLGMLNNRFNASFDVYNRQTKDMMTAGQPLPSVLGTSVPKENAADLSTKGWDLSIEWRDQFKLAGKPFSYSARFILSDNQTEITKYNNPTMLLFDKDNNLQYYKGKKVGEIWGFKSDGLFKDAQDVANSPDHTAIASYIGTRPIEAGDIKYKDLNGDKKITRGEKTLDNPGDMVVIGNTEDRFPFSVDLSADWNGFDFRIYLQGVAKKDYFPTAGNLAFWGIYSQPWANLLESNMDHWTAENPNGYFPRPKAYVAESNWVELTCPNDRYMQNAAYCRIKNLTVGYTLPAVLTRKIHLDRVRFYVTGENLAEFTALNKNLDPEGLKSDAKVYPFQRVYSVGVNLNF